MNSPECKCGKPVLENMPRALRKSEVLAIEILSSYSCSFYFKYFVKFGKVLMLTHNNLPYDIACPMPSKLSFELLIKYLENLD